MNMKKIKNNSRIIALLIFIFSFLPININAGTVNITNNGNYNTVNINDNSIKNNTDDETSTPPKEKLIEDTFPAEGLFINEQKSNENEIYPLSKTFEYDGYFANIVYYCDTTFDKALQTNDKIKYMSKGLTYNFEKDFDKAKELYKFVSGYITYDMNRYNAIKSRSNLCNTEAGAKVAFDTGKGVCFEYACLYAVMANAVGLKVRLIYTPNHIWNMIYDNQNKVWIAIDCTWKMFNFDINKYHKTFSIHAEF